jgi:hypothetical protein
MKIPRRSVILYPTDSKSADRITERVAKLLDNAIPNSVIGMLATAVEQDNSILIYNRWLLVVEQKHNYEIFDTYSQSTVYKHISLFSSALHIIFALNRQIKQSCPKDKLVYSLDQEYYRCLEDIRFFNKKLSTKTGDHELNAIRLLDRHHKLEEIKTRLSKIY